MTLTEFLLARIAGDEEIARDAFYEGQRWASEEEAVVAVDRDLEPILFLDRKRDAYHAANWPPARVLAECEAKRRIVEDCDELLTKDVEYNERFGRAGLARSLLSALAAIYADHEDYRDEWRP